MDSLSDDRKSPEAALLGPGPQRLAAYLEEAGITQADFAPRVGVTQGALSKMVRGLIKPSLETAIAIKRETNGAIVPEEWAEPVRGAA